MSKFKGECIVKETTHGDMGLFSEREFNPFELMCVEEASVGSVVHIPVGKGLDYLAAKQGSFQLNIVEECMKICSVLTEYDPCITYTMRNTDVMAIQLCNPARRNVASTVYEKLSVGKNKQKCSVQFYKCVEHVCKVLWNMEEQDIPSVQVIDRYMNALASNCFTCDLSVCEIECYGDTIWTSSMYLFPTASALNHSCNPNASFFCISGKLFVFANKKILPGDEITISYRSVAENISASLKGTWKHKFSSTETMDFVCRCGCVPDPDWIEKSKGHPIQWFIKVEECRIFPLGLLSREGEKCTEENLRSAVKKFSVVMKDGSLDFAGQVYKWKVIFHFTLHFLACMYGYMYNMKQKGVDSITESEYLYYEKLKSSMLTYCQKIREKFSWYNEYCNSPFVGGSFVLDQSLDFAKIIMRIENSEKVNTIFYMLLPLCMKKQKTDDSFGTTVYSLSSQ